MFEKLTRDEETQDILDELRDYRVPPEWYAYRAAAFRNQESRAPSAWPRWATCATTTAT